MTDRFLTLTNGIAMIVTDLHGDRDAFNRCLNLYNTMRKRGDAQYLVFLGDLIHGNDSPRDDDSLGIVLDLIAVRQALGEDSVIVLLGNHEMPHIYGVSLARGNIEYTPRFEHALGAHREQVLSFFESLPFYVQTTAGVLLSHAGPALDSLWHVDTLRHFDHRAILDEADAVLQQADEKGDLDNLYRHFQASYRAPYREIAYRYLAVRDPDDPRYPHLLRAFIVSNQSREFQILWNALFATNERGLTDTAYLTGCQRFLDAFSAGAPAPQRVAVSGHIATPAGHQIVNDHHLRLSSAAHAHPRKAGEYLLLDCAKPVQTATDLLGRLRPVFDQAVYP
ncbi:MAG: metallophosphoesterase [Anaerolineae bacterium]|nr:metallophosphoesterase [Anaerolineae bacterium]